jgi:hypothetical protein
VQATTRRQNPEQLGAHGEVHDGKLLRAQSRAKVRDKLATPTRELPMSTVRLSMTGHAPARHLVDGVLEQAHGAFGLPP